ncbi:MAG TPA: hypothetical protein VGR64_06120, partial [Terracidiphilus sp.]|nr:hypothetical protein [Terracidiphilus sp.]
MSAVPTSVKPRPSLDESTFQQILAAAYVVQQHNDGLRPPEPAQATSGVLTEIAEIQSLVRAGGLDLHAAARLVADRLQKITRAEGARIEFLSGSELKCIAETGTPLKTSVIARSLIAMEHLRQGDLFQSSDTQTDVRLGPSSMHDSAMRTLIVAPVHCLSVFAGFVEIHWARAHASHESDARACNLMAGLISGIFERAARAQASVTPAAARLEETSQQFSSRDSAAREQNDEFKPPISNDEQEISAHFLSAETAASSSDQTSPHAHADPLPSHCRVCGRPFGADEVFCGQCSMPRVAGAPSENLQSKWASLWYMQQAKATGPARPDHEMAAPAFTDTQPVQKIQEPPIAAPAESPEPPRRLWQIPEPAAPLSSASLDVADSEPPSYQNASQHDVSPNNDANSAAPTVTRRAQPSRQADLLQRTWSTVWPRIRGRSLTWLVGATGLLLLLLILAVWPSQNPQLTWFQSVLVQLGLADVPARPVVLTGNPSANVWVDVHTALYY